MLRKERQEETNYRTIKANFMYQRIKSVALVKCRQTGRCSLYPISDVSIWSVGTEIKPKK
jgi:hypothetical protein